MPRSPSSLDARRSDFAWEGCQHCPGGQCCRPSPISLPLVFFSGHPVGQKRVLSVSPTALKLATVAGVARAATRWRMKAVAPERHGAGYHAGHGPTPGAGTRKFIPLRMRARRRHAISACDAGAAGRPWGAQEPSEIKQKGEKMRTFQMHGSPSSLDAQR